MKTKLAAKIIPAHKAFSIAEDANRSERERECFAVAESIGIAAAEGKYDVIINGHISNDLVRELSGAGYSIERRNPKNEAETKISWGVELPVK